MRQTPFWNEDVEQDALGWDFLGAQRFQISLGLKLTHAERLRWLEEKVTEMQELCGLARSGRPVAASSDGSAS